MFRDYTYLSEYLVRGSGQQSRDRDRIARRFFFTLRTFLIILIVLGIPFLSNRESSSPLSGTMGVFETQQVLAAGENQDSGATYQTASLGDWPDLFGSTPSPVTPPTAPRKIEEKKIETNSTAKETTAPLIPPQVSEDKVVSAPAPSAEAKPDSAPVVAATTETPAPVAEKVEVAAVSAPAPVTPPVDAVTTQPEPVSPPKPKKSPSGYTIRTEGNDLVVYDAEGREVLRKARDAKKLAEKKKPAPKPAPVVEEKTEVVATQPAPSQPEPATVAPVDMESESGLVFTELKKGENLSMIAKRYDGVTAEDLIKANGIKDPRSIPAGTKIWIPNQVKGICHKVQEGETLTQLLDRYEIKNLFEVCDLNGLSRTQNELTPGTMLVLPGAKLKPAPEKKKEIKAITPDLTSLFGKVTWNWPVEGDVKISSPYGWRIDPFSVQKSADGLGGPPPRAKRAMHHGIDLALPVGTPVKAARDGEVIEVVHSRYGHGKMIKLRHSDGWCTVYSHNSKIVKQVGDVVKQGEIISYSGNTGRSTGPHLHFEIRRPDQKSVNPKTLLSASSGS